MSGLSNKEGPIPPADEQDDENDERQLEGD
jgi:hypothetical protein